MTTGEETSVLGRINEDGHIADLTAAGGPATVHELIVQSRSLEDMLFRLQALASSAKAINDVAYDTLIEQGFSEHHRISLPTQPSEVWGFDGTYETIEAVNETGGPALHTFPDGPPEPGRPTIFFKATASRCAAAREAISIRSDSTTTLPLPHLAAVLGHGGEIVGYTIACDLTARDLERQNPLFQPQAKVFIASCALGPVVITPDEIGDPRKLKISMQILRKRKILFDGSEHTARLRLTTQELTKFLMRDNLIPPGSVALTGPAMAPPDAAALQHGDEVQITIDTIGTLSNPVQKLLSD